MSDGLARRSFLRLHMGLATAGAAAYSMSTLFSAMKPILLTRFVEELGLSSGLAGLLVALPFAGIAFASLLMRGWLLRAPYVQIAGLFGAGLIVTEAVSAFTFTALPIVMTLQFMSGVCVGILMGATSRRIALTNSTDQLFGFVDMTAVLLMSFMVYLVGVSVGQGGLQSGYLSAAVISALFAGCLFAYRPAGSPATTTNDQPANTPSLDLSARPIAVVAMGVLFITFSGLGFAFMFTLAANLGMDYDSAGSRIGMLLFVSAFACQAGGWASARFGPERPLAIAFVTCAFGWWLAVHTQSQWLFMAALVPAIFSLQFNFPILLSFCGSLDEQGQWAAVASPLITSGFAWASILAGQIVGAFGLSALAWATALGMAVCMALLGVSVVLRGRQYQA